jgi:glycosyltransferase involved in cell wall biosynthesis
MIKDKPRFSIVTPTYNRAHLLPRVFAGLQAQTTQDFEWIVVDDGSEDATKDVVEQLVGSAKFPIRYLWQPNSGTHVSINRGVAKANGQFIGILDSDDYYRPDALDRFWLHWNRIARSRRMHFVGVTALVQFTDGRVVGTRFPADVLDSDAIECHWKYRVTGDKLGFLRTDVLREFPFPEDLGRFVPESLIWNRIALQYQTRFVNEIWAIKEYQADGLSSHIRSVVLGSPDATILALRELIAIGNRLPFRAKVLASAKLIRLASHKRTWRDCSMVPGKELAMALPLGIAAFLRDMIRLS